MQVQKFLRLAHRWVSLIVAPVLLVMIGAGIVLMLKKDIEWIQPSTQRGAALTDAPDTPVSAIFAAAQAVPEAGLDSWADVDRFDLKADRGVAKVVSTTRWEVQVDLSTLDVLQVAYRRSDLIETIHDGSFFADWSKHFLFLPVGVGLFLLWVSGIYLFFLPYFKRAAKKRRRRSQPVEPNAIPARQR